MAKPGPKPGNRILNNPETKDKIIRWVRDALVTRAECARRLGVDNATITKECQKDPDFGERLKQAEEDCRDQLVQAAIAHAKTKDWRAVQFLLQTKWFKEFARKEGTFTIEEFQSFALRMSDLVRKYVPESSQLAFATEVETIIRDMEKTKRKDERESS